MTSDRNTAQASVTDDTLAAGMVRLDPSAVAGDLGVDVTGPCVDPSFQVGDLFESGVGQVGGDHRGPGPVVTVDDHLPVLGNLLETSGNIVHRNVEGRLNAVEVPFVLFPNIDQHHALRILGMALGHFIDRHLTGHDSGGSRHHKSVPPRSSRVRWFPAAQGDLDRGRPAILRVYDPPRSSVIRCGPAFSSTSIARDPPTPRLPNRSRRSVSGPRRKAMTSSTRGMPRDRSEKLWPWRIGSTKPCTASRSTSDWRPLTRRPGTLPVMDKRSPR